MSEVQCPKCGEHHIRTNQRFFDAIQVTNNVADQPGRVPGITLGLIGLGGIGLSVFLYSQPKLTPAVATFSLFVFILSILFVCGAVVVGLFRNRYRKPEFMGGGCWYEYTCLTCGYRWPGHLTTYAVKEQEERG